ncbi:Pole remodelling regulatory diguanylate cyclase [Labilithrix luteola]|uniref:histidine kinase n=1 Tax=Labilithrix luteola TaxID=1391654 RepID=A0A0K1PIT6_9BACT|nr:hybrid sensor histidine kinase/response regulator [Labilithrix luteola]AKU93435.1 Pole remodelling regulatory diguanylate cyclase [Labilithrix luteola]
MARLLLVDDESRNLDVLEALLAPIRAQCLRAENGRSALAIAEREPLDLVLVDFAMPGLDGVDVLTHLRRTPHLEDLPVIVITGYHDREHRLAALEAGADDFLEKPIDAPVLLARVKTLLRLKASRDEVSASRDELAGLNAVLAERHRAIVRLQKEHRELMQFVIHDLKNPLATLTLSLESMGDAPLDELTREALDDALGASQRLQQMVADLFTISRLDSVAGLPLELERVEVGELIDAVARSYARMAATKHVSLVATQHDHPVVSADRAILTRVLENLAENSLRYTPSNGRVSFETHQDSDVIIRVSNSGPAIPGDDRGRIFQKFARGAEESVSSSHAGIGLYFCKRAVEAHGGGIDVVETTEFPTSFVIRLPQR